MSRPVVVAYVSGHGFGHFIRSEVVLAKLDAEVHVRCDGRALQLARGARWPASVGEVDLGPGAAQRGPLAVDLDATRAALERHHAGWNAIVDEEAAFARAVGARLIWADVPPVAFAIAERAKLPSVALANFSWSFIYEAWREVHPTFAEAASRAREAESRANMLFALEMGAGLESFPRQTPVRPVARRITRPVKEIRVQLGGDDRPIVLVTFGGFGSEVTLPRFDEKFRWLVIGRDVAPSAALPHQNLVAAVDCVLGKPGYSTVAESLARPTPFCYVPRDDFAEAPPLIAAMHRYLPCAPVEDFADLAASIERARACVPPEVPPVADGGAQVAAIVDGMLR